MGENIIKTFILDEELKQKVNFYANEVIGLTYYSDEGIEEEQFYTISDLKKIINKYDKFALEVKNE